MSAKANASPDAIDVVSLLVGLGGRWRLLAALSLGTGALMFGACLLMKPTYTSEAQIAILARADSNPYGDPKTAPAGESVTVRMDREAINTHARALQAPELAQRVVTDLRLAQHTDFRDGAKEAKPSASAEDQVLALLTRRLVVTPAKDSRTILIRYAGHDRDLVAEIVNRLGEVYRESLAARSMSESDDLLKGLAPRIGRLKQEVSEAEAGVERFRGEANLFRSTSQSGSLNEQQLSEMAAAETKARNEHAEADARAKAARQLEESAEAQHPDVQKSPVLQKLLQDRARIEGDVAKATAMLRDGHPAMKQLRSELASTERQLKLEVRRVIEGLDKEVSVAALRLTSVSKRLAELKARVVDTGVDQARLSQLEANVRAKRAELERLQAQYEANRARADSRIVPVEVQIVSRARPASEPTFPKPLPYGGLAALAALLLASSLTIARDLIVGARPAAPSATIPSASSEPTTSPAVSAPTASALEPTQTSTTGKTEVPPRARLDTIAEVANRLVARRAERSGVRTLVAGAGASVDPSAEAAELVRTLARAGGLVMLVDWSLDGNGVARELGQPSSPGLAELIDGKIGFVEAVGRVPGSAAQMIASGASLVSASARGDADRLNLMLDTLDEIYEQIVVVARFHAARDLFETIEGRFDFGVLVCAPTDVTGVDASAPGTFLGFEVDELEVLHLTRQAVITPRRRTAAKREHAA